MKIKGEPNGSGQNVFMHVDNGTWFDMDGESTFTSSYICMKNTEEVEVVRTEEYLSASAELFASAVIILFGLV